MNPVTRVFRTILQVLTALVVVLPAAVAFLALVGVTVDGAWIAAVLAAAVVLVTTAQNALEQAGLIPTLGGPTLKVGQPNPFAPLYTHAEVIDLIETNLDDDSTARDLRLALESLRAQCLDGIDRGGDR